MLLVTIGPEKDSTFKQNLKRHRKFDGHLSRLKYSSHICACGPNPCVMMSFHNVLDLSMLSQYFAYNETDIQHCNIVHELYTIVHLVHVCTLGAKYSECNRTSNLAQCCAIVKFGSPSSLKSMRHEHLSWMWKEWDYLFIVSTCVKEGHCFFEGVSKLDQLRFVTRERYNIKQKRKLTRRQ